MILSFTVTSYTQKNSYLGCSVPAPGQSEERARLPTSHCNMNGNAYASDSPCAFFCLAFQKPKDQPSSHRLDNLSVELLNTGSFVVNLFGSVISILQLKKIGAWRNGAVSSMS